MWECVKLLASTPYMYHMITDFNDCGKQHFEKKMWEKENAGYQHFLLFPQCCPSESETYYNYKNCHLQLPIIWMSKILLLGIDL